MTPPAAPSNALAGALPRARPAASATLWGEAWRRFRRHRLATGGTGGPPAAGPAPINEIDFKAKLRGPPLAHPLGTDDLGQDLLARMLYGGRISLAVGVAAMLIAIVLGTLIGALAGYVGGVVDQALMRATDLFLSLPQLPLLLLFGSL